MQRAPTMLRGMKSWKIALLCLDLGAGLYLGGKVTADVHAPAVGEAPLVHAAHGPERAPRNLEIARSDGPSLRADYGRASSFVSAPSPRR